MFNEWVEIDCKEEFLSWGFGGKYKLIFPPVVTYANTSDSLTIL